MEDVMRRATAAVLDRANMVGLLGWSWAIPSWATVLCVLGYASFGVVCILPYLNTFKEARKMNSVGGGTRGEPFVASVVSYLCSLLVTCIDNSWEFKRLWNDESAWINGLGAIIFVVYLAAFVYYADGRQTTLWKWVAVGFGYIILTVVVRLLVDSTSAVKWLCTVAGLVSACISLFLALFVIEIDIKNLPDGLSTTLSLLYYIVWNVRGISPKLDYHALGQNFAGVACSVVFLCLRKHCTSKPETAVASEREPLLPKLPLPPPHPRQPAPPQPQQPLPLPQPRQTVPPQPQQPLPLPQPRQTVPPQPAEDLHPEAANPAEDLHPEAANPAENLHPEANPADDIHQQLADPADPINQPRDPRKVLSAPGTPKGRPRPRKIRGRKSTP